MLIRNLVLVSLLFIKLGSFHAIGTGVDETDKLRKVALLIPRAVDMDKNAIDKVLKNTAGLEGLEFDEPVEIILGQDPKPDLGSITAFISYDHLLNRYDKHSWWQRFHYRLGGILGIATTVEFIRAFVASAPNEPENAAWVLPLVLATELVAFSYILFFNGNIADVEDLRISQKDVEEMPIGSKLLVFTVGKESTI